MSLSTRISRIYKAVANDFLLSFAFVLVFYLPLSSVMPTVEGKYFPVTSSAVIEEVSADNEGKALVRLTFENTRDCSYSQLTWFKLDKDGKTQSVYVNFLKDTNFGSRGTGSHRTQTWLVDMPADVVRDFSIVKVRHSCHFLWDTITQIYP